MLTFPLGFDYGHATVSINTPSSHSQASHCFLSVLVKLQDNKMIFLFFFFRGGGEGVRKAQDQSKADSHMM